MARPPEVIAGVADRSLAGATVLVTGSTSGIGRETALALGRLGARVFVHGRDADRGESVVDALVDTVGVEAELLPADFSEQSAVRDLAERVRDRTDSLDVLVNNAGGYFRTPRLTDDGIEYTFAVNHLAPFLLTHELLGHLQAAPEGRVVTTSSGAHRGGSIDFESFRSVEDYSAWTAYAQSKLANVLFTRELARREPDLNAYCFHPGFVPGSRFLRSLPGPLSLVGRALGSVPFVTTTPREGAATAVYLAAASPVAGESGDYFADCTPERPAAAARDDETARRLWSVSAEMTGLADEG